MSGVEQQMLAVGRGLMLKPRLLMLDEPSLGLAPVVTDVTFEKIREIRAMGTAILLVEQNVSRALTLFDRAYALESGKVIMHGTSDELAHDKKVQGCATLNLVQILPRMRVQLSLRRTSRSSKESSSVTVAGRTMSACRAVAVHTES
jgi:ABC-type multidrug transport system ATPase subunit